LAYNQRIEAERAQAELGWTPKVQLDGKSGRLRVNLVGRDGKPVQGLTLVSEISRPATNKFDRTLAMVETEPGVYEAQVGTLDQGAWSVSFTARQGDEPVYQAKARLWQGS
jgi:nitrogen fixation protein FixH